LKDLQKTRQLYNLQGVTLLQRLYRLYYLVIFTNGSFHIYRNTHYSVLSYVYTVRTILFSFFFLIGAHTFTYQIFHMVHVKLEGPNNYTSWLSKIVLLVKTHELIISDYIQINAGSIHHFIFFNVIEFIKRI
jgi:hypothetical protein